MQGPDDSAIHEAAMKLLADLRLARGIDESTAQALVDALRQARETWRSSAVVPKRAANLFMDLENGIEACSHSYEGDVGKRIAAVASEVGDLVRELLSVPEE